MNLKLSSQIITMILSSVQVQLVEVHELVQAAARAELQQNGGW